MELKNPAELPAAMLASTNNNQPGQGFTYEEVATALTALRLYINPNVAEFEIEFNKDEKSKFDDQVITILNKNRETACFAIQLKHAENDSNKQPKKLFTDEFSKGRPSREPNEPIGPFVLNHYARTSFCSDVVDGGDVNCSIPNCKLLHRSLDGQKRKQSEYSFILYTNKIFISSNMERVKEFTMSKNDSDTGKIYFDTSLNSECNIYKFQINSNTMETTNVKKEDYELFFSKFSLYTSQKNAKEMERTTQKLFHETFKSDRYNDFITFFRHCHSNFYTDRKIDKNIIRIQLIYLLLKPQMLSIQDKNLDLFEEALRKFEVAIINESYEEFSRRYCVKKYLNKINKANYELHKVGKALKIIKEDEILTEELKQRICWFNYKQPIFINTNSSESLIINAVLKWCRDNKTTTFVLVGHQIEYSNMNIFKNLGNLVQFPEVYQKLEEKLNVHLRPGKSLLLRDILKDDSSLHESVTPADLIEMLKGKFYVEERKTDLKKEFYMPRKVSVAFISKFLLNSTQNYTFIVSSSNSFLKKHQCTLIVAPNEELTKEKFDYMCSKFPNRNIHHVEVVDRNHLHLIATSGNKNQIKRDTVVRELIPESKLFSYCKSRINLICGLAGVGKTKMFRRLKENCHFDVLTVFVSLTEHTSNFNDANECLASFLHLSENGLRQNLVQIFENEKKIIFFLDGFDELHYTDAERARECIKQISQLGFTIWIAARDVCRDDLERNFKTLSITIEPFSTQTEQEEYVKKKLRFLEKSSLFPQVQKLISDLYSANHEILALPLHLSMIIEISLRELLLDDFNITSLYSRFIEGRHQQFWSNQKLPLNPVISEFLNRHFDEQYGKAALKTCLNRNLLEKLPVSFNQAFDSFLQQGNDPWGLFSALEGPTYVHQTYAEFFAASWISKNIKQSNVSLLKEIFDDFIMRHSLIALQILLSAYSLKSAEQNGLHLAIMTNSIDTVSFLIERGASLKQFRDDRLLQRLLVNGQTEMFKFLVENGIEIDGFFNGLGLLHIAVILNNVEMVRFLIDNNIDLNQECSASCQEDRTISTEMLVSGWEKYTETRKTPLDLAIDYRHAFVGLILSKKGAICNYYIPIGGSSKSDIAKTKIIRDKFRPVYKPFKYQYGVPNRRKQNYRLQQMPK